eukprot:1922998-Pyramimonas_sp.AAC.1
MPHFLRALQSRRGDATVNLSRATGNPTSKGRAPAAPRALRGSKRPRTETADKMKALRPMCA